MKHMPAFAAVALALALSTSPSFAQTAAPTIPFPGYMGNKPAVQPPYSSTDRVPVIRNGSTGYVPGHQLLTPDSTQAITNKTIDYNQNTFLNLPSSGGGGVLPTSCAGLPDGSLYNNNGTPAICTPGNNGTSRLTWDDSTQVTFDDGTLVAGF